MNIEVKSPDEMQEFGELIGRSHSGGVAIELVGDVGAGKTTLVKGVARGLGISETILSPTFTVSRVYDGRNDLHLAHYDFYRLHDAGIMRDEIDEVLRDDHTVTIVEWSGAVAGVLPEDRLIITITATGEESRKLELIAGGVLSKKLLEKLA